MPAGTSRISFENEFMYSSAAQVFSEKVWNRPRRNRISAAALPVNLRPAANLLL
jgi:hypothetical protein